MAQPVWTLSVDLQTKTATFTSGLADAAKGARGSFNEIKDGAREMGGSVGFSATEARHSVMMLGEEFGVHLPRALTSFIASLGPIGPAMEAAFPFLAILVGATLLLEHLSKLKEEGEKLTESQVVFGTTISNVLNGLNDRLLQAGIRADELRGDHLAALNKELELIDHRTFNELKDTFESIAKAADATFAELKAGSVEAFFQISKGSEGAKHALQLFKTEYESLLAQRKDKEAGDLLAGTLESAKKARELMQAQQGGHGSDEKELESQDRLIEVLQTQMEVRQKLAQLKSADTTNATVEEARKEASEQEKLYEQQQRGLAEYLRHRTEAENRLSALRKKAIKEEDDVVEAQLHANDVFLKAMHAQEEERAKLAQEAARESGGHTSRMAEMQLEADREANKLRVSEGKMTAQELIQAEKDGETTAFQTKQAALRAELAALDPYNAEFQNKQQALNNKLEERQQQHINKMKQLDSQAAVQQLQVLQTALNQVKSTYAASFSQVIMGKQTFAQMLGKLDQQMAQTALQNAMESLMQKKGVDGETRFEDARTSAANAFASMPNPILGALAAAGAFASVMAFEQGGIVPGVGRGDTVPAMLEPGEGVLTVKQMDHLRHTDTSAKPDVHVHHHAIYNVQAFDSEGVDQVLQDHGDKFADHAVRTLRKLNR